MKEPPHVQLRPYNDSSRIIVLTTGSLAFAQETLEALKVPSGCDSGVVPSITFDDYVR